MITTHYDVKIERSISDVFNFIAKLSNLPTWVPAVEEVTITSDGPVGVGTTFVQSVNFIGNQLEIQTAVTEFMPHELLVFESHEPIFVRFQFQLSSIESGVLLHMINESDPGESFGLTGHQLIDAIKRTNDSALHNLKKLMEITAAMSQS